MQYIYTYYTTRSLRFDKLSGFKLPARIFPLPAGPVAQSLLSSVQQQQDQDTTQEQCVYTCTDNVYIYIYIYT